MRVGHLTKRMVPDPSHLRFREVAPDVGLERYGRLLFTGAVAWVIGFAVWIAQQPMPALLEFVPDDAFYYLQIARHLAASGTPTFDGMNPTNGYHPAWLLLMAASASLLSSREALVTACLLMALTLHTAGSLVMAVVLRHVTSAFWGWIGGTFWLLNPLPLLLAAQGVEAALYLFTLQIALLVYVTQVAPHVQRDDRAEIPRRSQVVLGLSLSAVFWARTDALILIAIGLLTIAGTVASTPAATWRWRLRRTTRTVALVGGVFVIGVLPWFVYASRSVGSVVQDSSAMKVLWASERFGHQSAADRLVSVREFLIAQWFTVPFNRMFDLGGVSGIRGALFLIVLALAVRLWARRVPARRLAQLSAWLIAAAVMTGAAYALLLGGSRFWYLGLPGFVMFFVLFTVPVANLIDSRLGRSHLLHGALGSVLVLAGLVLGTRFWLAMPVLYPWQPDVYSSQRKFDSLVSSDALMGSFNAGIPAYFSQRTVVNLDGLVNNTAQRYWQARRFDEYVYEQGIIYIADEQDALARGRRFASGSLALTPIAAAPLTGWPSSRWLWRVERPVSHPHTGSPGLR